MTSDEICLAVVEHPIEFEQQLSDQLDCDCLDRPGECWRQRLLRDFWRGVTLLIYRTLTDRAAKHGNSLKELVDFLADAWSVDPVNVERFLDRQQGAHDADKLFSIAKCLGDTTAFTALSTRLSDIAGMQNSMQTATWLFANRHAANRAATIRSPLPTLPTKNCAALMLALVEDAWLHRAMATSFLIRLREPDIPLINPLPNADCEGQPLTHLDCSRLLFKRVVALLSASDSMHDELRTLTDYDQYAYLDHIRQEWHWSACLTIEAAGDWINWTLPRRLT